MPETQIRFESGQVIDRQSPHWPSAIWRRRRIWRGCRCPRPASTRRRKIAWDRDKVKGRPFFYFAYGAACAEVTIDTLTGEMRVDRVDILHDVGRSLNPAIDIGQIEGGFVQGMGWLTTEELVFDDAGTPADPCAVDLQDPQRLGCAGRFPRRRSTNPPATARTRSTAPRRWASRR